ncbi:MAG: hypothetical protein Q8L48_39965 [Archangium sp.]|nr:hypothetical protein [Archangium sp.]
MLKPVASAEAVSRLRPIAASAVAAVRPRPEVLGDATQRVVLPAFEQALRQAIAGIRETVKQLETESDGLTRHLGYRALNRDVSEQGIDPQQLPDPEDRAFAHDVLRGAQQREAQCLAGLDAAAREDLEVVLQLEQARQQRTDAEARHRTAVAEQLAQRGVVEGLARDARSRERLIETPSWTRWPALVLSLAGLGLLVVLVVRPALLGAWAAGLPVWRWTSVLAAVALTLAGGWFGMNPLQRRAWWQARLQRLATSLRSAREREEVSANALRHARKLFEDVDAECRREEEAARAVLQRRPGAKRYVSLSGPSVLPGARAR